MWFSVLPVIGVRGEFMSKIMVTKDESLYKEENEKLKAEIRFLNGEITKLKEALSTESGDVQTLLLAGGEDQKKIKTLEKENATYAKLKEAFTELVSTAVPTTVSTAAPTSQNGPKILDLSPVDPVGRLAVCYAEALVPKEWASSGKFMVAMENRFGAKESPNGVLHALNDLVLYGFLEKRMKGSVAEYHVKMEPDEARKNGLIKEAES
jgi:hypothetical protein